jgi:hypothetical protein
MKTRKPLQRGRRKAKVDEGMAKRYWKLAVCRGGCVMCRAFPVGELDATRAADLRRIEGHHVIAKRHLRREGHGGRLWDARNGMGLCAYHHQRHELRVQPVPYELVPEGAFEFAIELGLDWIIDREYPEGQS